MRRFVASALVLVLAGGMATATSAQMSSDGGWGLSIGAGNYLLSNAVLESVVKDTQEPVAPKPRPRTGQATEGSGAKDEGAPKLTDTRFVRRGGYATAVEAIGETFPENQRARAESTFGQLLANYPAVIKQLGQSENDLAAGLAAFIAGNYSGYHNIPFPDDKFAPLVAQLRQSMERDPNIAKLDNAGKQQLNDILAAVGMQMAITQMELGKNPDPALARQLRLSSQNYLMTSLGIDAARLRFTSTGMVM